MPNINIAIKNKIAYQTNETEYICGNSGFLIAFNFDAEWDEYEGKTARFVWNGGYQDIVFTGNQCEMPVISNTNTILCGVFAGNLCTTTPAVIRAQKSILCGNPAPAEAQPDVFEQMLTLFNNGVNEARASADEAHGYAQEAATYVDFDWFPRFWREQYEGVVLEERTENWVSKYGTNLIDSEWDKGSRNLNADDTVVVYWDGESFECTVKESDRFSKDGVIYDIQGFYIGNLSVLNSVIEPNTGEPFYIRLVAPNGERTCAVWSETLGTHTFSMVAVEKKNCIPDKFLSNTVVKNGDKEMVLTSPSGKAFKITVDDNGALTATAL